MSEDIKNNSRPENIVGKPTSEMTATLKRQDEIQRIIRESKAIRDVVSMVTKAVGGGEYALRIGGQEPEEALEQLYTNTGIAVVSLQRRREYPEEASRLFADEEGLLADWRDRFEREGHIFKEGERVLVPAFIEVDREGNMALVADDQDGRMADKFHLGDVSDEVKQTLERYQGVAVGCIVNIQGVRELGFQLSDIHEYDVELEPEIAIPPINPTSAELENLPAGARVIIEGRIVKVEVRKEKGRLGIESERTYLTVESDDGRQITVGNWSDKLRYSSGVLENLRDKKLEEGELVRITSYVDEQEGKKTIHSHWSRPYLVEPSPQKKTAYEGLRESVSRDSKKLSELIQSEQYPEARRLFAELRTRELIQEESDDIIALLASFPEEERPIYDGYERRMYGAESLDEAYGVLVESMTRSEFEEFAREVGTGRREETGEHCDASYAYLIMKANEYDDETMLSVLSEAIDQRLERLKKVPDEHEQFFPHKYMLEKSLGYISSVGLPEGTQKILEVVRYVMEHKHYDKRKERAEDWGCPHKFLSLLLKSTDSLVRSIREHPDNLDAIEDLDELLAWQEELSEYPFCDTSVANLRQISDRFRIL